MSAKKRVSARKKPTQERALATVDAILRASAHILRTSGYGAATTNRIAERAGVSIGSLYQYFPSKEAIMNALLQAHVDGINAELVNVVAGIAGQTSLAESVRTFITAVFAAHSADPKLHNALTEHVHELGGLERIRELVAPGMELVRAYLIAHVGEWRAVDPELAAYVLVNAVEAVAHAFFIAPSRFSNAQMIDELCLLVERYLQR